jgi:hypothetical protein
VLARTKEAEMPLQQGRRRAHDRGLGACGRLHLTSARCLSPRVLLPEALGFSHRIDLGALPPHSLVTGVMERSMVRVAERHDPLTAGFGATARGWAKRR